MKKINYILIAAVSALCACSDMNSLHDKYLADGETIYLARFDSVKIYPGKRKSKSALLAFRSKGSNNYGYVEYG